MAPLVALFEWMPPWLKHRVCGHLAPGHAYTLAMIRDDFNGFVLDPFCQCRHCGMPLPDNILAKLLIRINDDDYDEEIEAEG